MNKMITHKFVKLQTVFKGSLKWVFKIQIIMLENAALNYPINLVKLYIVS